MAYLHQRLEVFDDDLVQPDAIDAPLWSILRKSLRNDPKQRQGTAVELAGDIEVYMATGEGIAEDDDMSVTIRGMTSIPEDIIMAAQQFQDRLTQPGSPTVDAPTLTVPERPAPKQAERAPAKRPAVEPKPAKSQTQAPEPPPKPSRRSRSVLIGVALLAAAAGIGAAVYYLVAV